jgi:cytoskeletal protein RodZ
MSEQAAPDRLWSGIEVSKIIAGTLAAVTAAVVGSFLGVAGTLVGAAVASVVGSVGTEIYQKSLHRGTKRLAAIAPTFVKVPAAAGTPPVAAATEEESPSHTVAPRKQIRWGHAAAIAGVLFVLAIGTLTAFELITGKSMASTVGNSSSSGTSVGSVLKGNSTDTPAQVPSAPPASDGPTADPTDRPNTEPSTEPTTEPTTTAPTTEPATQSTEAPQQDTPPADTQDPATNSDSDQGTTTE